MTKSLYLYASGYWLDAIVQYGKLTREYRDGLPKEWGNSFPEKL